MDFAEEFIPRYTYADWLHWEGRWELMNGHPIAMSPAHLPEHQRIAAELKAEFTIALRNMACKKCRVYDPIDYKISEDTILQPDMLVVCGEIKKPFLDFAPALVAEVLSPATLLRDRNLKYRYYEQQKVAYYLIVDIQKKELEIYALNEGRYKLQPDTTAFTFTNTCTVAPVLENIWA